MPAIEILFVFVGEDSTDEALVSHLKKLCVLCGADSVTGIAVDWMRLPYKPSKKVVDQIASGLKLEPNANLIFIHRDADSRDPEPRYEEIRNALAELAIPVPGVAVVPVQETEAWLLLDENEIRRVAENPKGKVPLDLPTPAQVENLADPKRFLFDVLVKASGASGRHLERLKRKLSQKRRQLLERLRPDGQIMEVPAWRRLRDDLRQAIQLLGRRPQDFSAGSKDLK